MTTLSESYKRISNAGRKMENECNGIAEKAKSASKHFDEAIRQLNRVAKNLRGIES